MRSKAIMCPTDFSETASHALGYAYDMAKFYGVDILLVHVVDKPFGDDNYRVLSVIPDKLFEDMEAKAKVKMAEMVSHLNISLPVETVIRYGPVVEVLLDEARFENVGMIVIASHGHTGLSHFLHPNVAESVANRAKCPVLVVKSLAIARLK